MKPENARVWRKTRREALKGVRTGHRLTHRVETQQLRLRAGRALQPWDARRLAQVPCSDDHCPSQTEIPSGGAQ